MQLEKINISDCDLITAYTKIEYTLTSTANKIIKKSPKEKTTIDEERHTRPIR